MTPTANRTLAATTALVLAISFPSAIDAQTRKAAPAQKIDEAYTAKIKEYLQDPRITTELVDHLPASATVPTPLAFHGRIVERDVVTLEARLPDTSEATRRAWATALAIVWLEEHASEWQPEWHLLSGKARQWLARRPADVRGDWIDVAREVLANGA